MSDDKEFGFTLDYQCFSKKNRSPVSRFKKSITFAGLFKKLRE